MVDADSRPPTGMLDSWASFGQPLHTYRTHFVCRSYPFVVFWYICYILAIHGLTLLFESFGSWDKPSELLVVWQPVSASAALLILVELAPERSKTTNEQQCLTTWNDNHSFILLLWECANMSKHLKIAMFLDTLEEKVYVLRQLSSGEEASQLATLSWDAHHVFS